MSLCDIVKLEVIVAFRHDVEIIFLRFLLFLTFYW